MALSPAHATRLLARVSDGDSAAADELVPLLYGELRRIAGERMGRERADHTLQPTELVNEVWLRVFDGANAPRFESRAHFLRLAARAMRNVLIDHARTRGREKRGAYEAILPLDEALAVFDEQSLDVVEFSDAVDRLAEREPQLGRIVELRFFGGLTIAETAEAVGVSTPTVERGWRIARLWLRKELRPDGDES